MKQTDLKSYDISSFEIGKEYDKEISKLETKIKQAKSRHEEKSERAHNGFLRKEKSSKRKISEIKEHHDKKLEQINTSTEETLATLRVKEQQLNKELEQANKAEKKALEIELEKLNEQEAQISVEIGKEKAEIIAKYKENNESYREKLAIYKENFVKNTAVYEQQLDVKIKKLDKYKQQIKQQKNHLLDDIESRLNSFKKDKEALLNNLVKKLSSQKEQSNQLKTTDAKMINDQIQDIKESFSANQADLKKHFTDQITFLTKEITSLKEKRATIIELIDQDLSVNNDKLDKEEESLSNSDKVLKKKISKKRALFEQRATTTKKYQLELIDQELKVYENEKNLVLNSFDAERFSYEQLERFLTLDEESTLNLSHSFENYNSHLCDLLNQIEETNNTYEIKHKELKTAFLKNYVEIFDNMKSSITDLVDTELSTVADNYTKIDEINMYLDTSDTHVKIEVNNLRKKIEVNEIDDRFSIKHAKIDHQKRLLEIKHDFKLELEALETKEKISHNNKAITNLKNKKSHDITVEEATFKNKKAEEIKTLRIKNTKLERRLLDSKFETEVEIFELKKQIAELETKKDNALYRAELTYKIDNLKKEASYEIEVINQTLEDDLLTLTKDVSNLRLLKEQNNAETSDKIATYEAEVNQTIKQNNEQFDNQIKQIEKALAHETKQSKKYLSEIKSNINEKKTQFDHSNKAFLSFIDERIGLFGSKQLSLEKTKSFIRNNARLMEQSKHYLSSLYEIVINTVEQTHTIKKENLSTKYSDDQRKLNREKNALDKTYEAQLKTLKTEHKDYITTMRNLINAELDKLMSFKTSKVTDFLNHTELIFNKIFRRLKTLEESKRELIEQLYEPLVKKDRALIAYAKENATKAIAKVDQKRETENGPLIKKIDNFKQNQQTTLKEKNNEIDDKIDLLTSQINNKKTVANKEKKSIENRLNKAVKEIKDKQEKLETEEQQTIVQMFENLDKNKSYVKDSYDRRSKELDAKDEEAKRIFSYEERIYNVSIESAKSRLNDAKLKTENVHLSNLEMYKDQRRQLKQERTNKVNEINNALKEKTKNFEESVFRIRPKLEESDLTAKKNIELEIEKKQTRLSDLKTENRNILETANNRANMIFVQSVNDLDKSYDVYLSDYKKLKRNFNQAIKENNQAISDNINDITKDLYAFREQKHQDKTALLKKLMTKAYDEEVHNG
ncbi:MAG: hypothetical protein K9L74_00260 [Candidatus Izimaplasma sp.]|nr:hypothetical protein [Candidatus Izimaplasma bacterium]